METTEHGIRIAINAPSVDDPSKMSPVSVLSTDAAEEAPLLQRGDLIGLPGLPSAVVTARLYFAGCGHFGIEAEVNVGHLPEPDTLEAGSAEADLVHVVKNATGNERLEAFRDLVKLRSEAAARALGGEE